MKILNFKEMRSIVIAMIFVITVAISEIGIIIFVLKKMFFLLYQLFVEDMIHYSQICTYKWADAFLSYLEICVCVFILQLLMVAVLYLVSVFNEKILNLSEEIILGKNGEYSLEYSSLQIWFIKLKADFYIFTYWIRFKICGIRYYSEPDNQAVKRIKIFTLEGIVCFVKGVCNFFFTISIKHVVFVGYVVYIYYAESFLKGINTILHFLSEHNEFTLSNAVDFFEVITVLAFLAYLSIDIRYKISAYNEIRTQRFKQLYEMEERMLSLLMKIDYALEKNIESMVETKPYILQEGAEKLTGKRCSIRDNAIEYKDRSFFSLSPLSGSLDSFEEIDKELDELKELNEEFEQSSLNYFNIAIVDSKALFMRLRAFYRHGNREELSDTLLCKSAMEKWFNDMFVESISRCNEGKYYTIEEASEIVIRASNYLNDSLTDAFEIQVHVRKHKNMLRKKFKRIHKLYRFNIK